MARKVSLLTPRALQHFQRLASPKLAAPHNFTAQGGARLQDRFLCKGILAGRSTRANGGVNRNSSPFPTNESDNVEALNELSPLFFFSFSLFIYEQCRDHSGPCLRERSSKSKRTIAKLCSLPSHATLMKAKRKFFRTR